MSLSPEPWQRPKRSVRRLIVAGLRGIFAGRLAVIATVTLEFVLVLLLVDCAQAITDDRLGLQISTAGVAVCVVGRTALDRKSVV